MTGRRAGVLRLLAVVVAGGALVGVATASDVTFGTAQAGPGDPVTATVGADPAAYPDEVVLACPGTEPDLTAGTSVRVVAAPPEVFGEGPVPTGAPALELARVGDGGVDTAPADAQGRLSAALDDGSWGRVRARGEQAPGVAAAQLSTSPEAGARGWALTPCTEPSDVVHLVGGGEGAGRVELVVVTNPSADPVTVDLEVFGEDGEVATVGGSGLVLPPHGRLVQRLEALAPDARHPVVRVVAQGGPMTAHLVDRERSGTTDLGHELVAAAAAPATELVVPALPEQDGGSTRTLRLFAPEGEAVVELRALTEAGARVPDPAVVRVPAGRTVEVEVEDLPDGVGALRLRADAPVTAGALLRVAPASEEPVVLEDGSPDDAAATTASPDDAATTASPDDAATTAGPDEAATTAGPDDAATTASPDDAATTAGPDDAATTARPDDVAPQPEPVRRPAGESAWVAAVPLSQVPLGIALPGPADPSADEDGAVGGSATLAVSAVDGTTARVLWLDDRGRVRTEELTLAHDTTHLLRAPARAVAVWVVPTDDVGVAAALHLAHEDAVGPYLTAATLPQVPWAREVPAVLPVLP